MNSKAISVLLFLIILLVFILFELFPGLSEKFSGGENIFKLIFSIFIAIQIYELINKIFEEIEK